MKNFKSLLFVFVLSIITNSIYAQPPAIDNEKAHRRYWYYRTRMINDFMKVGKEQGECIVITQRHQPNDPEPDYTGPNQANIGPDQLDVMNQYLSALALEFKILSRNNQSTTETIKEIYHILYTINRLDAEADQYWRSPVPNTDVIQPFYSTDLNGFMLREDMPKNFINTHYLHYNYAKRENPNDSNGSGYCESEYIVSLSENNKFSYNINIPGNPSRFNGDGHDEYDTYHMIASHDKYYSMFVAFMFLVKYLPDNIYYYENGVAQPFQDGTSNIKQEVRNITERCHNYLQGKAFGQILPTWFTNYPDGHLAGNTGQGTPYPLSYPLADMVCKIKYGYPWYQPCLFEQDIVSAPANEIYQIWSLATLPNKMDNAVFLAYSQAGSNLSAKYLIPIWLNMHINANSYNLEWAELLRKVLHEDGGLIPPASLFAAIISSAPCEGPYNFKDVSPPPAGEWSSQDRLEHSDNKGTTNSPSGRYPGADYMLLHNLYYEYLNQLNDANNPDGLRYSAYNLMDNHDESVWPRVEHFYDPNPYDNIPNDYLEGVDDYYAGQGGVRIQANIKVFQNLTSRAQIYASVSPAAPDNTIPSKVVYRAGKDITLLPEGDNKPGFEVKAGSTFDAYIARYLCTTGDYGSGLKPGSASQNNNMDYETDSINTFIPIHNVYYPKNNNSTLPNDGLSENTGGVKNGIFEVSPNPSYGKFKVKIESNNEKENFTLTIYNMSGSLILTEANFTTKEIDLSNYPSGIYIIRLTSDSGNTSTKKISLIK